MSCRCARCEAASRKERRHEHFFMDVWGFAALPGDRSQRANTSMPASVASALQRGCDTLPLCSSMFQDSSGDDALFGRRPSGYRANAGSGTRRWNLVRSVSTGCPGGHRTRLSRHCARPHRPRALRSPECAGFSLHCQRSSQDFGAVPLGAGCARRNARPARMGRPPGPLVCGATPGPSFPRGAEQHVGVGSERAESRRLRLACQRLEASALESSVLHCRLHSSSKVSSTIAASVDPTGGALAQSVLHLYLDAWIDPTTGAPYTSDACTAPTVLAEG